MTYTRLAEEAGKFAEFTNQNAGHLESGFDQTDFQARTVRVCSVYTRQDVALLVYHALGARVTLEQIKKLLITIIVLGVIALVHWWK
jgi:hypothetical protein